jgi:hypothetical protein
MYRIVQTGSKTRKVDAGAYSGRWRWVLGAVLAGLALAACGPDRFVPSKDNQAWVRPPIWIESTPDWTIVVEPPTGGWQVSLDQIMEQLGHTEVFVTIRPPNPAYLVTPAPVQQRVVTSIHQDTVLWVYAREQNWKGQPAQASFSLAAKSIDARKPPEKAEEQK